MGCRDDKQLNTYMQVNPPECLMYTWVVTSLPLHCSAAVQAVRSPCAVCLALSKSKTIYITQTSNVHVFIKTHLVQYVKYRYNHAPQTNKGRFGLRFLVRGKNMKMECNKSTCTVGVFIVFNNRQYYNIRQSSNEQDAWAAGSRKPFCTLDIHDTRRTNWMRVKHHFTTCHSLQTSTSVTSLVRSSERMVALLWRFKKLYWNHFFSPFLSFPPTCVYICGLA